MVRSTLSRGAASWLAARAVDAQIGVDFFNDAEQMYRDLLSDVARDYLRLLFDGPR